MSTIFYLLFLLSPAHAQYSGVSAYAGMSPNFPCSRYLKIAEKSPHPAMVVLWNGFGADTGCIQRFMTRFKDRPHLLEIHFSNEVCRRNHNCGAGDLLSDISVNRYNTFLEDKDERALAPVRARANLIRNVIETYKNENTKLLLSTGLEDNYSKKAYKNLLVILSQAWAYPIVRSPLKTSASILDATFRESHGDAHCCDRGIVNEDGITHGTGKSWAFLKRNKKCYARFLWRQDHQGVLRHGRPVYPRYKRKFVISDSDIRKLGNLLKSGG